MERRSLDTKRNQKEKINILTNNSKYHYEKKNSYDNNNSKDNHKLCKNRTNFLVNNKQLSTIYLNNTLNGIHLNKKNIRETTFKNIENNLNILTFSNPNFM